MLSSFQISQQPPADWPAHLPDSAQTDAFPCCETPAGVKSIRSSPSAVMSVFILIRIILRITSYINGAAISLSQADSHIRSSLTRNFTSESVFTKFYFRVLRQQTELVLRFPENTIGKRHLLAHEHLNHIMIDRNLYINGLSSLISKVFSATRTPSGPGSVAFGTA